jgi:hypothetical protein
MDGRVVSHRSDPVRPLFVVSGLAGHFAGYQQLKGYAAAKKIPLPGPAVLLSGAGILAAGGWESGTGGRGGNRGS